MKRVRPRVRLTRIGDGYAARVNKHRWDVQPDDNKCWIIYRQNEYRAWVRTLADARTYIMIEESLMEVIHKTPVLNDVTSTGKAKHWQGFAATDGTDFYNYSEHWQDGTARQQSAPSRIEPKNVGKKNETSPKAQAIAEINADCVKKQKKGYVPDGEERTRVLTLPMLAHSFEKRSHDIHWPCYVQRKLDGIRAVTDGKQFWSREGNVFPPESVAHLLHDTKGQLIDGELILPPGAGFVFEETSSAVKAYDPLLSPKLEYHVFDTINETQDFEGRFSALEVFYNFCPNGWHLVDTLSVDNREQVEQLMGEWVEQGYEGVILRNPGGMYKPKHRSKDLQKWKPFLDAEFVIVGYEEGKGKDEGTPIWVCEAHNGKLFKARPRGKSERRQQLWRDRDKLIGAFVTVTYQNLSADGVPRFPVAKAIRDYE